MPSWSDLGSECLRSARILRERGCARSTLSRAYYSVYADVSRALASAGVNMAAGRAGPAHSRVVNLVVTHLKAWLSAPDLGRLSFLLTELYRLRLIADYVPAIDATDWDARHSIGYLVEARGFLRRIP